MEDQQFTTAREDRRCISVWDLREGDVDGGAAVVERAEEAVDVAAVAFGYGRVAAGLAAEDEFESSRSTRSSRE